VFFGLPLFTGETVVERQFNTGIRVFNLAFFPVERKFNTGTSVPEPGFFLKLK